METIGVTSYVYIYKILGNAFSSGELSSLIPCIYCIWNSHDGRIVEESRNCNPPWKNMSFFPRPKHTMTFITNPRSEKINQNLGVSHSWPSFGVGVLKLCQWSKVFRHHRIWWKYQDMMDTEVLKVETTKTLRLFGVSFIS